MMVQFPYQEDLSNAFTPGGRIFEIPWRVKPG